MEIVEKALGLREVIRKADHAYYVLADPIMSDPDYDGIMNGLKTLEREHPELITPDSPTQRVGSSLSGDFQKVEHSVPMLSLLDAFEDEDLDNFLIPIIPFEGLDYTAEAKFDGLAIKLVYECGKLVKGITRGDGNVGEDVTHNVRTIKDVPLSLNTWDPLLEVNGEVIIEKDPFIKYNQAQLDKGLPVLANTRNGAAGSLRQKDPAKCAARPLSFRPYGIGNCEGEFAKYNLHDVILEKLKLLGFNVAEYRVCKTPAELKEAYKILNNIREELPYDIDGMVIKVNQLNLRQQIGFRSRSPKWALAYKFEAPSALTTIEDIELSLGRTGAITPVALLKEVECGGVMVTHASLYNQDEIERLKVDIGSEVLIKRAGDVIPKVVRPIKETTPYQIPDECPRCGQQINKSEIIYRCINPHCQLDQNITYFVSDKCMDIVGLSEKRVIQMVEQGLINNPSDIFKLTKEQLLTLPKVGDKLAIKTLAAIQKAADGTKYSKFLCSLQIPGVGETTSEMLANFEPDVLSKMTEDELLELEDIGPTTAESIHRWFNENQVEFSLLQHYVKIMFTTTKEVTEQLTFVFTGKVLKPRKELSAIAKAAGHKVSSSVSKKVILVAGENAGSKLTKAKDKGARILTEDEFLKLLETT